MAAAAPCERCRAAYPKQFVGIYRTFSATTRPQTTSEITDAATKAKIVRFFSFNSFNPETTTKKIPLFRNPDCLLMRTFALHVQGPGAFRHHSVSAARVTLEHRRLSVTNLAHDLHRPLAVRTEGHLGSGQERDHPQGPLASTALGGRSHGDVTISDGPAHARDRRRCAAAHERQPEQPGRLHCLASDGKTGQPPPQKRPIVLAHLAGSERLLRRLAAESRQRPESEQATRRSVAKLRVAVTGRAKCGQCTTTASSRIVARAQITPVRSRRGELRRHQPCPGRTDRSTVRLLPEGTAFWMRSCQPSPKSSFRASNVTATSAVCPRGLSMSISPGRAPSAR